MISDSPSPKDLRGLLDSTRALYVSLSEYRVSGACTDEEAPKIEEAQRLALDCMEKLRKITNTRAAQASANT